MPAVSWYHGIMTIMESSASYFAERSSHTGYRRLETAIARFADESYDLYKYVAYGIQPGSDQEPVNRIRRIHPDTTDPLVTLQEHYSDLYYDDQGVPFITIDKDTCLAELRAHETIMHGSDDDDMRLIARAFEQVADAMSERRHDPRTDHVFMLCAICEESLGWLRGVKGRHRMDFEMPYPYDGSSSRNDADAPDDGVNVYEEWEDGSTSAESFYYYYTDDGIEMTDELYDILFTESTGSIPTPILDRRYSTMAIRLLRAGHRPIDLGDDIFGGWDDDTAKACRREVRKRIGYENDNTNGTVLTTAETNADNPGTNRTNRGNDTSISTTLQGNSVNNNTTVDNGSTVINANITIKTKQNGNNDLQSTTVHSMDNDHDSDATMPIRIHDGDQTTDTDKKQYETENEDNTETLEFPIIPADGERTPSNTDKSTTSIVTGRNRNHEPDDEPITGDAYNEHNQHTTDADIPEAQDSMTRPRPSHEDNSTKASYANNATDATDHAGTANTPESVPGVSTVNNVDNGTSDAYQPETEEIPVIRRAVSDATEEMQHLMPILLESGLTVDAYMDARSHALRNNDIPYLYIDAPDSPYAGNMPYMTTYELMRDALWDWRHTGHDDDIYEYDAKGEPNKRTKTAVGMDDRGHLVNVRERRFTSNHRGLILDVQMRQPTIGLSSESITLIEDTMRRIALSESIRDDAKTAKYNRDNPWNDCLHVTGRFLRETARNAYGKPDAKRICRLALKICEALQSPNKAHDETLGIPHVYMDAIREHVESITDVLYPAPAAEMLWLADHNGARVIAASRQQDVHQALDKLGKREIRKDSSDYSIENILDRRLDFFG